jgi:hypothetical protein
MLKHITYALLDAARLGMHLQEAKTRNQAHDCLYRGESEIALAGVAPHIFQYAYSTPFANWYLHNGWGDSWGVLLKSAWPLSELHKHFRKFLLVKTEDGPELYFRFYDPRVLRIFLPTCDAAQLREFFGGAVDYFIAEDEDPDYALRFSHQNGVLQTERISVRDQIASLPKPAPLPPPADDPLPPETIAALKEQGITLPNTTSEPLSTGESTKRPAEEVSNHPVAPVASAPASPAPKPKTKWNMFE